MLFVANVGGRLRVVGPEDSVCDCAFRGRGCRSSSSYSSPSSAVNDCLSFDGEDMGDAPDLLGGVDCLPMIVVGEDGEDGRRKGEVRGELKERDEGLYADVWRRVR